MSRINGEKARSAVHRKRAVVQRDKARAMRAAHMEKVQAETPAKAAPKAETAAPAAPAAEKVKKTAPKVSPESVIESLKPKPRAKATPKTEE